MKKNIIAILILIVFIICFEKYTTKNNYREMHNCMESHGYKIVNIDTKVFDIGPFYWYEKGKGNHMYEIKYQDNKGIEKIVWFKTGWNNEWRNVDGSEFK